MDIKTIQDDNIYEYFDQVDEDVSENIGRMYYRGIAGHNPDDDSLLSLLIWELRNVDSLEDTSSEIKYIYAIDSLFLSNLLKDYGQLAQAENVKKTFFESTSLSQEKEEALAFSGFSLSHKESKNIEVTVKDCKKIPFIKKAAPPYVQSIRNLNAQEYYQGIMNILFKYDSPMLEDLVYLPKDWFDEDISCYTKTDGKVTGLFLFHVCPSGIIVPVLFYAVGADGRMNLLEMLRFSIDKASLIFPEDTTVRIIRRNDKVSALSEKLFPGKKGASAIAGQRTETII